MTIEIESPNHSEYAQLNPELGPWELHHLFRELVDTHPTLARPVNALIGGTDLDDFRNAEPDELSDVRFLFEAFLERWSVRNGVAFEDAPATIEALNRLRARKAAERLYDAEQANADETTEFRFVTVDAFAAEDEAGADALLGDGADALIPANGDVMVYGDGGAGKTTLCVDLGCHLAAGNDWLGIKVARAINVAMIENEGPRSLFRAKLERKLKAWNGSPLAGRLHILEEPWARLSIDNEHHRLLLARFIQENDIDVVIVGPLVCSGFSVAGLMAEVRAFLDLVTDVRTLAGRLVTFVFVHHENKGGQVSGAWEGAGDTLLHVQGMGHGRTRMHVQKARWSPSSHAQSMELRWIDGEGFEIDERPEVTDDDIAAKICDAIDHNPGTGWSRIEEAVTGVQAKRRRAIRDRLLRDGTIVNVRKENGREVAVDHVPERTQARLHLGTDPAISHLRPDPDADGTQMELTASARGAEPVGGV